MNSESSAEGEPPSAQQPEPKKPMLSAEQIAANKAVVVQRVDKWVDVDDHNVTNPNLQR